MSLYPVPELLAKWATDEITVEQAVGQMLQHLKRLNGELDQARAEIAALKASAAHSAPPATPASNGKFVVNGK